MTDRRTAAGSSGAAWDRQVEGRTRVSAAMVSAMDTQLRELEAQIVMPHEFVVPGETALSAALEVARTILRRAERRAVSLEAVGQVPGDHLLPYLNRTADLLWVLARAAEQAETRVATPARLRGRTVGDGSAARNLVRQSRAVSATSGDVLIGPRLAVFADGLVPSG